MNKGKWGYKNENYFEYPQTEYEWENIKVFAVPWDMLGQKYIAQISWQVSGIPFTTLRKVYYRKNGSMYCKFCNRTFNVN